MTKDTPSEGLDPKAVAFMVSDPMIPHQPVKARGWSNEPFPALYPAAREADAREAARILRADCVPLYAAPLPIASDTAGLPSDCAETVECLSYLMNVLEVHADKFPVAPHILAHVKKAREAIAALSRAPEAVAWRELDLSKAVKHEHPDISTDKQYLVKIYGGWHFGKFTRQWFGLSFSNWGTSGCQFDAPGFNASKWERVIEIDPEALAIPPAPQPALASAKRFKEGA